MFILKLETLDIKYTAVVISATIVYFEYKDYNYNELLSTGLTVKFNAKEQKQKYNRTYSNSTMEYWKQQPQELKNEIFYPSVNDVLLENGLNKIKDYIKNNSKEKNDIIWTNGHFSAAMFDSLCNCANMFVIGYKQYRDLRTAIDLTKDTAKNGKCTINSKYSIDDELKNNNPLNICVNDIFMLLYGV